jgi:hypothetical protein
MLRLNFGLKKLLKGSFEFSKQGKQKNKFIINKNEFYFSEGNKGGKGSGKPPADANNQSNKKGKKSEEVSSNNIESNKLAVSNPKDEIKLEKKDTTINNDWEEEQEIIKTINYEELVKKRPPLKAEKYEISHKFENDPKNKVPNKQKKLLENLVTQMLRNEGISSAEAKEIKKDIRDPMNNAEGRYLLKINDRQDMMGYIQTFSDLHFYKTTFESLSRIIRRDREIRELNDPAYIQLRSQHKLVTYENMKYLVPETIDVRQNVNSKDWLKTQPRITKIDYSYNIEGNKEFHKKFSKMVDEDRLKMIEKQKLMKYIKLNPHNQQVKDRFIRKMLPDGITPDMIPDYDVDIKDYRPKVTKKSRRKFNREKVDTNFKNYEAWRCFDRNFMFFNEETDFLKVNLIPKYVIAV